MRKGPPPQQRSYLESAKTKSRRHLEGWFDRFCPPDGPGLDLGCSDDPVHDGYDQWDFVYGDGDATVLAGVPDNKYRTVYSSHLLEHLYDPISAVRRWYEVVAPGGHLIVCVPHRDLYEKQRLLPSRFNGDHKAYWLPDRAEPPHTFSLLDVVKTAVPQAQFISLRILDDQWEPGVPEVQSPGEYAIEMIVRKPR